MKMLHWRAVAAMVVKLLSITGEDKVDVSQKYQRSANSRLSTRLVLMSNDMLDLKDETGVAPTRLICLGMLVSWLNKEDFFLFEKLERELPGIFNKALAAMDAARERGRLTQPKSGAEIAKRLLQSADTLIRWMMEDTVVDGGAQTSVDSLYTSYRAWLEEMGYKFFVTRDRFSERLQSFPGVNEGGRTPRSEGRTRTLRGIRLKSHADRLREAGETPDVETPVVVPKRIREMHLEAQRLGVTLSVMVEQRDGVITWRAAAPDEDGLFPGERFTIEANYKAAFEAAKPQGGFRRRVFN
jgi:phage/plasmid-associated DNA primase